MYILSNSLPIGQWVYDKPKFCNGFGLDDLLLSYSIIGTKIPVSTTNKIHVAIKKFCYETKWLKYFRELKGEGPDDSYYGEFFEDVKNIIEETLKIFNGKFRLTEISLHDRMHTIVYSPDEIQVEVDGNSEEFINI